MDKPKPISCLAQKPNRRSVYFNGVAISVEAIAIKQRLDQGYLSRIFSGKRVPSIAHAQMIAAALGMGLEDFIEALEERVKELMLAHKKVALEYMNRINLDNNLRASGKIVPPALPGTE